MAHKIHLQMGVKGTTACAASGVRKDGTLIFNARTTYRHMGATVVTPEEFRATPADHRCAHCVDRFTPMMNERRARLGMPLYADAMTKTLKEGV